MDGDVLLMPFVPSGTKQIGNRKIPFEYACLEFWIAPCHGHVVTFLLISMR